MLGYEETAEGRLMRAAVDGDFALVHELLAHCTPRELARLADAAERVRDAALRHREARRNAMAVDVGASLAAQADLWAMGDLTTAQAPVGPPMPEVGLYARGLLRVLRPLRGRR